MKLDFNKAQLLSLIDGAIGFAAEKGTMPILANFLLQNKDGKFSIVANNTELQATVIAELGFEQEFAFTVPAKKLKDSVTAIASDSLSIELDVTATSGGKAIVKGGRAKYTLQSLPASHYPVLKRPNDAISSFTINRAELHAALELVAPAQGINDARIFLNATLFEMKGGELNIIATDAHRLSKVSLSGELFTDEFSLIIPRATVAELIKLSKKSSCELVQVSVYNNQAVFNIGDIEVISKLIDGTYPDYRRVIPAANDKDCVLSSKDLLDAVRRVNVIGNDKLNTITFTFEADKVRIRVRNDNQEVSEDEIAASFNGNAAITMNYNVRYWLELLPHLAATNMVIKLFDAQRAILLSCDNNKNFQHIIMPLRG